MDRLPMCRICSAENARLSMVANRNLHKLYETLTNIPFVTEDSRPLLACVFCFAKLNQCYRLLQQCLKAEELFAQNMSDKYKINPLINQAGLEFISIDDECETGNTAIKEELPADSDGLDDGIESMEEYQSDELEPGNLANKYLDVADILPHCYESDYEDDIPLIKFKTEVEDEKVSKEKRRVTETIKATVVRKPKQNTRETNANEKDAITAKPTTKDKSKVIRTIQKWTPKAGTYFKEPYICIRSSTNNVKKEYKCHICQRVFTRSYILTNHMRTHTGDRPYKCNVCQRNFNQKNILVRHFRTHTGDRPYKCDVCQRKFSQNNNLTIHMRTHTGEKPYECEICQRNFREKSKLTLHMRRHTGEKPYKCDVCQRNFIDKTILTVHMRSHTGEKPYQCDICQRNFSIKANLSVHLRTCGIGSRTFSKKINLT